MSILVVIEKTNLDLDLLIKNNACFSSKDAFEGVSIIDIMLNYKIQDPYELDYKLNKLYTIFREKVDYQVFINVYFQHENLSLGNILNNNYSKTFIPEKSSLSIAGISYQETIMSSDINYQSILTTSTKTFSFGSFEISAVGGTFDHLHDGHKILLSIAIFLTKKKLIIGLTGEELLINKKFKDQLQSYEVRKSEVLNYVTKVDDSVDYDVLTIRDVCGPTGYEPNIQALIVSKETEKGGDTINEVRRGKGLKELEVFVVDILGGNEKLSSTTLRQLESENK